jgi:amino acid permease
LKARRLTIGAHAQTMGLPAIRASHGLFACLTVIALSCFSIPGTLAVLATRRKAAAHHGLLYLFGAFIVACGVTHLFGMWTFWVPDYGAEALAKVLAALISLATAIAL